MLVSLLLSLFSGNMCLTGYGLGCLALSVAIAVYHFLRITTGSNSSHIIGKERQKKERGYGHPYEVVPIADYVVARIHATLSGGYGAVHTDFDCAVARLLPPIYFPACWDGLLYHPSFHLGG